ncbi:MAG: hypothetical protein ALAOOOJD_01031 [bacterium]|nr:hypothetical protein [bacterium]
MHARRQRHRQLIGGHRQIQRKIIAVFRAAQLDDRRVRGLRHVRRNRGGGKSQGRIARCEALHRIIGVKLGFKKNGAVVETEPGARRIEQHRGAANIIAHAHGERIRAVIVHNVGQHAVGDIRHIRPLLHLHETRIIQIRNQHVTVDFSRDDARPQKGKAVLRTGRVDHETQTVGRQRRKIHRRRAEPAQRLQRDAVIALEYRAEPEAQTR